MKHPRKMKRSEVQRLAFCDSPKMPRFVNDGGQRKEWVGIGWIPVGAPKKTDIMIVEG